MLSNLSTVLQMVFEILLRLVAWSKVQDGKYIAQAYCDAHSVHRQGYCDRNVVCRVDTARRSVLFQSGRRKRKNVGLAGSQLNNLPFRRYDGVTLDTLCVSGDIVAAIVLALNEVVEPIPVK